MKQSTIGNCWRYVKILPPTQQPTTNTETDDDLPLAELQRHDADDDLPLAELQRLLYRMPAEDRMNAIDYVNIDREIETGEMLTDDNILEMVSKVAISIFQFYDRILAPLYNITLNWLSLLLQS